MATRTQLWMGSVIIGSLPFLVKATWSSEWLQIIKPDLFDHYYGSFICLMALPTGFLLMEFCSIASDRSKQHVIAGHSMFVCSFFSIVAIAGFGVLYGACELWTTLPESMFPNSGKPRLPNRESLFWATAFLLSSCLAVTLAFNYILQKREEMPG